MSGDVKYYSPKGMAIGFGPVVIVSGWGPDEYIKVVEDAGSSEDEAGVDGEVTVSQILDFRATVTMTLMQTAKANEELSVLYNAAKRAPGMIGAVHPFWWKNMLGKTLYTGQNAWVMKAPEVTGSKKATTRAWDIRIAHLNRFDAA